VLAYEINCRLIDAFDISTRGWDPPVFSPPAVALAAGKLMKLGPEKLTQAVNLAINDHIPMGHVWTAPAVQEESDYQRSVRVRSCIRPLSAAVWPLALM
jgi:2-methylcitrate dehydratase PrpD